MWKLVHEGYKNLAKTDLNMGEFDYVAASDLNMAEYENVDETELDMGDFENLDAFAMNPGVAEPVHSGYVHMDVHKDLLASTDEGDDAVDVDDSDSDDPNFRRADWESSLQS